VGLITSALGQDLERIGYPKGSYVPSLHLTTICIPSTWITPQGSSRELRHSRAGASVAIPIENSCSTIGALRRYMILQVQNLPHHPPTFLPVM
jgi:hypothetical protein